jgi:hypothetical protein
VGAPALVRNDPAIHFNWGQGEPAERVPGDSFSARWTRILDFDGATYRFYAYVDDGVRLWVDDVLVIDAWYDSSAHTVSADHPVVRGRHRIRVEYYEHVGDALIEVWWERTESYPDWKGRYWSNRDLSGSPALVRNDPGPNGALGLDFTWGPDAPASGLPEDSFSVRWTRDVEFEEGTYRFFAYVDDGVRLWVDNEQIIDAWYDSRPHEVTAEYSLGRGRHEIRVEYYEHTGGARIEVWWERVGAPSYSDWKGEYWSNRRLSGSPTLTRNDRDIEFDWGADAPASGLPRDEFSIRWSRTVDFRTGIYRFRMRADDGIRFYIGPDLAVDEWHDSDGNQLYSVDRTLFGEHQLVVEYYERVWDARVQFWWTRVQRGPIRD